MISLTSSSDNVKFKENIDKSKLGEMAARVSRTATLDGGSVLIHSGVSHTDRTLKIRATIPAANEQSIQTMFTAETDLRMACADGFFAGAIARYNRNNGAVEIDFWPTAKIA